MIRVERASVHFGGIRAVDEVSFEIPRGKIVGLIGPNGAGKTTIFNAIAGHVQLTSGHILLKDKDISAFTPQARARRGLARTFQIPHEFSRLSVLENLMAASSMPVGENILNVIFRPGHFRSEEHAAYNATWELIEFLELEPVAHVSAGELSGGQKKLLELGRAEPAVVVSLREEPEIVLLDEIGAGINRTLLSKVVDKIRLLNEERGLTFCLIEHDLHFVKSLCSEAIVMVQGRFLTRGPVDEVAQDERVIEAYFGGGKYEVTG